MTDLETRLSRLERAAGRWRIGCVAACAALALLALGGTGQPEKDELQAGMRVGEFDLIRTKAIGIYDADGNSRIMLGSMDGDGIIQLSSSRTPTNDAAIVIRSGVAPVADGSEIGPMIAMQGHHNQPGIGLSCRKTADGSWTSVISLAPPDRKADGSHELTLAAAHEESSLRVNTRLGEAAAVLGDNGKRGGFLLTFDNSGEPSFLTPDRAK